ncbi:hypothetical protein [Rhodococcus daqingensis]|uniref:Uncharacterized protein n=1 Tax=Rhodococcus daqingensis TaxID=2479363 RepID=A0ABW2S2W9_9NOCA
MSNTITVESIYEREGLALPPKRRAQHHRGVPVAIFIAADFSEKFTKHAARSGVRAGALVAA